MPALAVRHPRSSSSPLEWWHRPSPSGAAAAWLALAHHPTPPPQDFDPTTLDDLPAPGRRLLARALPAGTPLATAIHLGMRGELRVDGRWLPFEGEEIIRAGVGFVWRPVVGGRLVRLTGADVVAPGGTRTELRLHGLLPVVRGRGAQVSLAAAGRLACETVAWLPQAITPQVGARWHAVDAEHAVVSLNAAGQHVDVAVTVDPAGRLRSASLARCPASSPTGRHQQAGQAGRVGQAGIVVESDLVTTRGVTIAGSGTAGWVRAASHRERDQLVRYTVTSAGVLPSV